MSLASKRRLILALLVGFALWPLVHRGLVARYEVSPWRLGGWAMYCTPKLAVEVAVVPEVAGQPVELELPASLRERATRFARRRAELGRLVDSQTLAAHALETLAIEQVVITIERRRLDPGTGRIAGTREYFRYRRDAGGRATGGRFATRPLP